jgi:microsomal dipeptidase-like Zn-dependent dipeptidase
VSSADRRVLWRSWRGERPVFDAHTDSLQRALDLGHDLGQRGAGHLDLVRAREGGLGALVFVCWCDPKFIARSEHGARDRTRELLREFHRLLERHPDALAFAGDGEALVDARSAACWAGIPGIEGGHSIEASLDELEWFFEHGVRVMTLVWNNHLDWIRSCQSGAGAEIPAGLSDFGRSVVRRMNELGMLIDLSHAGRAILLRRVGRDRAARDRESLGLQVGVRTPTQPRRRSLRALARNGGVVGMVFCTAFLDAERAPRTRVGARARSTSRSPARARPSSTSRSVSSCNDARGRSRTSACSIICAMRPRSLASSTLASGRTSTASSARHKASKTSRAICASPKACSAAVSARQRSASAGRQHAARVRRGDARHSRRSRAPCSLR